MYFPLRVIVASPWGSDLDDVTRLPASSTGGFLCGSGAPCGLMWHGGRWRQSLWPCPILFLPPPTQAMHHLQRTAGHLSACWLPRAPTRQAQGWRASAALCPYAKLSMSSVTLRQQTRLCYSVFQWHSKIHANGYPVEPGANNLSEQLQDDSKKILTETCKLILKNHKGYIALQQPHNYKLRKIIMGKERSKSMINWG